MVDAKRRKGESFEGLLRRFSRRLQQSGNMLEARKLRFFSADPSKNKTKESALRRLQMKEKRDYLVRIGVITEDRRRGRGRRR